ncbi:putative Zn finger protein [Mucilaginibacter oryzae]|uniref:Putative Zn finger protein n=1 Tax=Mucilaginibacter oryzae TaxID=468058 RepID=A0A316H306_9SPHI|nr:SWIM zinc finger family protein [Mucilaginibacter oryzae]PWK73780.1 putative Zn finger protein [Mucilaginibacter oryzae]
MKTVENNDKFTIYNFDHRINATILQRGKGYYNSGAIINLEEDEGTWTAEVEGTDDYEVTVTLTPDYQITNYFCDCPFDGDICKHVVAVFFQLRDEVKHQKPVTQKEAAENNFQALINKISIDEYRGFVNQLAKKDKNFKAAFELFFADKDDSADTGQKYVQLVQRTFKKFGSAGYIDYQSARLMGREIDKLIEDARHLIQKNKLNDAFAMTSILLTEVADMFAYIDDSSGAVSERISDLIELIHEIADNDNLPVGTKMQLFDFLKKELQNDIYFDLDCGYDLFELFENLASELNSEDVLLHFVDAKIAASVDDIYEYRRRRYVHIKIDFLKRTGQSLAANALIEENLDIQSLRQAKVNEAIAAHDFDKAKKLIAEGIKIAEAKKHPGTVSQWKKELLRIAVLENDVMTSRMLYKEFALDNSFNREYYNCWKATHTPDELPEVVEALIKEIISDTTKAFKKSSWSSLNSMLLAALGQIYIEEKYWNRLFNLVKDEGNLNTLMKYHKYLHPHYPAELTALYLPALESYADHTTDRNGYANLVNLLQTIKSDIPVACNPIMDLVRNFKLKYARRRAMMDELSKLD